MNVQTIKGHAFSIYISSEEVNRQKLDPSSLSYDDLRRLTAPILKNRLRGNIQFEVFPGKGDLLIFVREEPGFPVFFVFESFEDLIDAVAEYSGEDVSSLYYLDQEYILAIWSTESSPAFWAEFGDPLKYPPDFIHYIKEHGKTVIEADAISTLKTIFY